MHDSYIAVDLGAGSGRVMLGSLSGGRLELREVRRFSNRMIESGGALTWDAPALLRETKLGISEAIVAAHEARSVGVDAWGVDFGLLDSKGELVGNPLSYRDPRFAGSMTSFLEKTPGARVFSITGIQFLEFNTLFRLHAMAAAGDRSLARAKKLLFMPDLVANGLCGSTMTELTVATTSQMVDASTGTWSEELIGASGADPGLFGPIAPHGTFLGEFRAGPSRIGLVSVASHDTASAVAAVPARKGSRFAYISCGTWSLMGYEARSPATGDRAFELNFTSEGGACGRFRILKNITGLWPLQECLRRWNDPSLSWDALMEEAASAPPHACVIDPDDPSFSNPVDMPEAITEYARRTGQAAPATRGGIARTVIESLSLAHARTLGSIREIGGGEIDVIHVIGGGSRNRLLCALTADACKVPVLAGPAEATAAGNVLVQAMAGGRLDSLDEVRRVSRDSFSVEEFEPRPDSGMERAAELFESLVRDRLGATARGFKRSAV